jgi:hypothetical protein
MFDNNVLYTILLVAGLVLGASISHYHMKGRNDASQTK